MNAEEIEISVVVPMFNEEDVLDLFFLKVEHVLDELCTNYEIVCIDDGSKDKTKEMLLQHHSRNKKIKILILSRNFGKEAALTAGFDFAQGQAVIPIDADLQDPPELIKSFYKKWKEGYSVVYAYREGRPEDKYLKKKFRRILLQIL